MIRHKMLTTSWQLAVTSTLDDDPGADYVSSLHPERMHRCWSEARVGRSVRVWKTGVSGFESRCRLHL